MKKKIFIIFSILIFVLLFSACKKEKNNEDNKNNDPEVVEEDEHIYFTVSDAIMVAENAGSDGTSERKYVKGTVKSISNAVYGEMYITDGENDLYIYGLYSSDGSLKYSEMEDRPYSGDVVYIEGILKTYNGKPEMGAAWLVKFESNQANLNFDDYQSMKIDAARASADGTKLIVEGTVAYITYANGMNPNGIYLVDDSGSIYVYGLELAGRVKIGQSVKVAATRTSYILESEQNQAKLLGYQGSIQLQDAHFISASTDTKEFDKNWIKESSVKKIIETPLSDNITTDIFKVKAVIKESVGVGFTNYYIDDLDGITGSYVYSLCNGADYAYLNEFDGKVCDVYLSALNCKSNKAGAIYRFVPILVEEAKDFSLSDEEICDFVLEYYAAKQFLKVYNSDPAKELGQSFSNEYIKAENVQVEYQVVNSNLVELKNENDQQVMHISKGNEKAQIKMSASYNNAKKDLVIDINIDFKDIPTTISIKDAIDSEDGTEVTLRGIVMSGTVNQTGFYLNDGTGIIAVLTDSATIKTIALGNDIVIKGTKNHKTNNPNTMVGQIYVENASLVLNLLGDNTYSDDTFITDLSFDQVLEKLSDLMIDQTTNVYVCNCYINKVEGTHSTNYYLAKEKDGKDIYLYAGSGSQYSIFDELLEKEVSVTFAFVNWNSKSPYRACIISATDGETSILNNYNFR